MKIKKILSVLTASVLSCSMGLASLACGSDDGDNWTPPANTDLYDIPQDNARTYYEIFVRSFADGDGNGVGDFRGLINNLDYLNDGDDSTMTDLGINGIWLMPIFPTTTYHGYDVKDYRAVNPQYGTMDDFDELIKECNKRGIWVQLDLVLNHSSSSHPWFLAAVEDAKKGIAPKDSAAMQKYSFMVSASNPSTNNIAGKWHQVSGTNYWYLGNFDGIMPDINLNNEEVRADIQQTVDFWLEHGVRSFRLDAVPYAFGSDATDAGEENINFWTWFNDYCNKKGKEVFGESTPGLDRYCYNVAEVWAGSQVIKEYFKTGMTSFNYSMGGNSQNPYFTTVNYADDERSLAYDFAVTLEKEQNNAIENGGEHALLSNFLSNHDNTRSSFFYGYKEVSIKQGAALYLLAPGNSYIYYGEELGAIGTGSDPNLRKAFNWGDAGKGPVTNKGLVSTEDQVFGTWKSQTNNANSILTFYREAIKLRNRFPEIARGKITPLGIDKSGKLGVQSEILVADNVKYLDSANELNAVVAVYSLTYKGSTVIIAHNLGSDAASFDISKYSGYSLAGALKANGGSVKLDGTTLSMSGKTAAVLSITK